MQTALYVFTIRSFECMNGQDENIWEDPVLKRWLDTIVKSSTKHNYKSAFKTYLEYTKISPGQMIDEAVEDSKKDPRQRRDILLTRILGFYTWLKNDYERKSRGTGPHRVVGKGLSDKLATCYTAAVRSFYGTYDLTIKLRGRRRIPRARVTNKRMIVGAEQVKVLYDHARSPRDRALILVNFQGGLDASTLCSIKYGDLAEGLAKNEHPLKLALQRPKTGTDFYTFMGKDAVEAVKAYLADMKQRGVEFTHGTPLFLQGKSKGVMLPENIQDMMREVALRAGFIDAKNNGHEFNPLGPHALRESFGSIMTNSGVPDTVVDFWLGHEIGEMAEAYKGVQLESLKQMYLAREKLVSISAGKVDVEEIREKLRTEMEQQNKQLQIMVNSLVTENMDLKNRVQSVERKFSDIEKTIQDLKKAVES
jgi:integrase/recombinase XerD